jgi:hypothetical protein
MLIRFNSRGKLNRSELGLVASERKAILLASLEFAGQFRMPPDSCESVASTGVNALTSRRNLDFSALSA